MQLVSIARNPVPMGAKVAGIETADGHRLRVARWESSIGIARGTVCLFHGRGEYIEKYFETITDLRRLGFAVATLDWRGQGLSDRPLRDRRKGHVLSFAEYEADIAAFMERFVLPTCPPPYAALAHSMGGHVLLRHAAGRHSWFERIVATAPMLRIADAKLQTRPSLARFGVELMSVVGMARAYVPRGNAEPLELRPFEGNPLTSDRARYRRNQMILEAHPELGLGAPTNAWMRAAFRSMAMLSAPSFPAKVKVPVLMVGAGEDRIVTTRVIEDLGLRLKLGTHVLIPEARHEILQETDAVRLEFWSAFHAFLTSFDVAA